MNFLIIELAAIGVAPDKKERLLVIPVEGTVQEFLGGEGDVYHAPTKDCFLTISYAEYEANKDNYEAYREKLIAEKKAALTPAKEEAE